MREADLRKVLLVKAVEDSDRDATLLPPADRAAAGREAMRRGTGSDEGLLVARADVLLERIVARHPFVTRVLAMLGRWRGATPAIAIVGLALGVALSALDGSRRINVLAFPLLGVVAWNFLVYAMLMAAALRKGPRGESPLRAAAASMGSRFASRAIRQSRRFNAPLAEALRAFSNEWYEAARPLLVARATYAFHLAAAAVGVGLVAGLYARGIALDYQAGWESTFLDAPRARSLLQIFYGPAAALTGIAIPDATHLEAIRWRGVAGGESAARWIHLMAMTAVIYVVVPRLVLALLAAVKASRLASNAPAPAWLPVYFRTAFASIDGAVPRATAIVMPYACAPGPGALARLIAWVGTAAGGPVDVEARDSVPYGSEERYLAELAQRGAGRADILVLPFDMSTTPEAENHGLVLSGVRDWIAATRPGARLLVVIDESGYAERMGGVPERLAERREAWRRFVESHGLTPAFASFAP